MSINAIPGDLTANSYVTLDEALEYFINRSHGEEWEDLENQEALLITATNQIDWFFEFPGTKTDSQQPLSWPRTDAYDTKNNIAIEDDVIPMSVKQAVFELAMASIDDDRVADDDLAGLEEVKMGPFSVKTNSSGTWQTNKSAIPDVVRQILNGILKTGESGMFRRVVRF